MGEEAGKGNARGCSVEGCVSRHCAKGYCAAHYNGYYYRLTQARRRAKALEKYYANKPEHSARTVQWKRTNVERARLIERRAQLKKLYNLTTEDYDRMRAAQNDACAICARGCRRRLVIDHCHKTGRIRGLLCDACNKGIGLLRDDEPTLLAAIEYLKRAA